MIISTVDVSFIREEMRKASHRPNRPATVFVDLPDSVAVSNSKSSDTFFTSTKLRTRSARFMAQDETEDDINSDSDEEYQPIKTLGRKNYKKVKIFLVTEKSCVLADQRMTSIRQQADQLQTVIGKRNIAASPATVYRRRQEMRMKALAQSESSSKAAQAVQLCYDGRVIHKMDRYVFYVSIWIIKIR